MFFSGLIYAQGKHLLRLRKMFFSGLIYAQGKHLLPIRNYHS
jgi:hypothetical protein